MPPEPAPLPTTAFFALGLSRLTLNFDRPLAPGPLSSVPWSGLIDPTTGSVIITPAVPPLAAASRVTFSAAFGGPGFGPNTVSYVPPPADLTGITGTPVAPIVNFPVTITP